MKQKYNILIIGGGTGGIMVAAQLKNFDRHLDIAILEPSETHWYQPAWTLVGAGTFDYKKTARPMKDLIPNGVDWIKDKVTLVAPDENLCFTEHSGQINYDYLVVAPGLVYNMDGIKGLKESLGKGVVCSNYTDPNHTWEVLQNFKGGNAVFTQPNTPIKCGGAPQKIAYLAADYFRKHPPLSKTNVIFATPGSVIFGVKDFAATLMKVIKNYGMDFLPFFSPVEIDAQNGHIYYQYLGPKLEEGPVFEKLGLKVMPDGRIQMPFDMLHLAPPQKAPDFIKESGLANETNWMQVDIHTLQHMKYPNVFGLGDVAALPTAKTGAAIRKQAPVVVKNLISIIKKNKTDFAQYEGYSSCPLVTGYGKMVLAEFKYDNVRDSDPLLSKFVDTAEETWSMWLLKKYGLPFLYWNQMMKGKM